MHNRQSARLLIFLSVCFFAISPLQAKSRAKTRCDGLLAANGSRPGALAIKDQGCNPYCSWYAKTTLVEDYHYKETGQYAELSTEGLIAGYMIHMIEHSIQYDMYPYDLEKPSQSSILYYFSHLLNVPTRSSWITSPVFEKEGFLPFAQQATEIYKMKISKEEKKERVQKLASETLGSLSENPTLVKFHDLYSVYAFYTQGEIITDQENSGFYGLFRPFLNYPRDIKTRSELLEILDQALQNGHSVVASVAWDRSVEKRHDGVLAFPLFSVFNRPSYDNVKASHDIFIYGRDRFGRYEAQNSWGTKAGRAGKYLIGRNYLKRALFGVQFIANPLETAEYQGNWRAYRAR